MCLNMYSLTVLKGLSVYKWKGVYTRHASLKCLSVASIHPSLLAMQLESGCSEW